MCIDPVMCECVWLMIVVHVCRLGEEYGCGCVYMWVSREVGYRGMFSAVINCTMFMKMLVQCLLDLLLLSDCSDVLFICLFF